MKVHHVLYNADLIDEAEVRVDQLDYLVSSLRALEAADRVIERFGLDEPGQVRLYAEAFYYFGHRLLVLCSKNPTLGLKGLKCAAVKHIRNQLIEHTEGSGRHGQSLSWAFEDGRGPVLKGWLYGGAGEAVEERGLFRHADELRVALEATLTTAIAKAEG
jgi:hypothetical protein